MESEPRVSVIVTTYNKERELGLVLEGYRHQRYRSFEVIVADDGSGPATAELIKGFQERAGYELIHSWQEDEGFRAARSRNLAIGKARGELVVLTDGDCVPLPGYLEAIVDGFPEGGYRAGERYLLSEEASSRVDVGEMAAGGAEYLSALIPDGERRRIRKLVRKNRMYRALRLKERPKVMTCNMAVWRRDLEAVNGFDERYVGWGHEDTDLGRRLRALGVRSQEPLSPGLVLHLWHPTESSFKGRVRDCDNAAYFDRPFLLPRCRRGLKARAYGDLRVELKGREAEVLETSAEGEPELEVWVVRRGEPLPTRSSRPVVAVLEAGAELPARRRSELSVIVEQGEPRGLGGEVYPLPGERLDGEALERARGILDAEL